MIARISRPTDRAGPIAATLLADDAGDARRLFGDRDAGSAPPPRRILPGAGLFGRLASDRPIAPSNGPRAPAHIVEAAVRRALTGRA